MHQEKTLASIKQQIAELLSGLNKGIYEKEEAMGLGLLAAIAGESLFLLGPPGVAKSLVARRLKHAFADGKSFEYLMSRFSTPDEIFGPVSIKKLKDEDKYERLTDRYMPGANVVFLDEIWKAGPSIQNALLTILNEKVYKNGDTDEKVSIHLIVSASNELPPRNEGLEALWDRFLIRYEIGEIRERSNFLNMISGTADLYGDDVPNALKISQETLFAWQESIKGVALPDEVLNTLQIIKMRIDEHDAHAEVPFSVYDRRWKKAVNLLRTSAFLNGREAVDLMDCFLLTHCLWSSPLHQTALREIIAETIRKHGYSVALNLTAIKKEVEEFENEVRKETRIAHKVTVEEPYLLEGKYYEVLQIGNLLEGKYIKSAEFERLSLEEEQTIGLYDELFKLTYKMRVRKSPEENKLEIYHNSQEHTFQLKTEKREVERYISKAPHAIVLRYWRERTQQLSDYLANLQTHLDSHIPEAAKHLQTHLFVDKRLAPIVEANLNEAANTLRSLALRVEKNAHYYEHL